MVNSKAINDVLARVQAINVRSSAKRLRSAASRVLAAVPDELHTQGERPRFELGGKVYGMCGDTWWWVMADRDICERDAAGGRR